MSDALTELINGSFLSLNLNENQTKTSYSHRDEIQNDYVNIAEEKNYASESALSMTTESNRLTGRETNAIITSDSQPRTFDPDGENEVENENEEPSKLTMFLDDAYKYGANAIDLSHKSLEFIPKEMNKLQNLQVSRGPFYQLTMGPEP
jgi:hypothetical protein